MLPDDNMYQQTQAVTQTQTATYQNTLVIDSSVTERDGVYTCSVTNARGYDNGAVGMGGKVLAFVQLKLRNVYVNERFRMKKLIMLKLVLCNSSFFFFFLQLVIVQRSQ